MSILKKIDSEILMLSTNDDTIASHMDKKIASNIKKIGLSAFLATAAFLSSGIGNNSYAMDDSLKGMLGVSTLVGVVSNGNQGSRVPADCPVRGANGWKIGGGAALGSVVGNQIGSGSGRKWATAIGGLFGGTAAATSEANRIERECANYMAPAYRHNRAMPNEDIIYQGTQISTRSPYYVTLSNSPGIAVMTGRMQANISLEQAQPIVSQVMNETSRNLEISYHNFENVAQSYNQRMYGNVQQRYNINQYNSFESTQQRQQLEMMRGNFEQAYQSYAIERAKFLHMADNAALDNINISQYAQYLNYMQPPQIAKIAFNGNLHNKKVVLPNAYIR